MVILKRCKPAIDLANKNMPWLNKRFSTHPNLESHREFLSHFNRETIRESDVSTNYHSTVKHNNSKDLTKSKNRFSHGYIEDGDMYSGKPVWQQLNEIESTWKMKFKHKSRIQVQRQIAKAKSSVETLGELENNPQHLVSLDNFREIQNTEPKVNKPLEANVPLVQQNVNESRFLVNDLSLKGDAYYEKLSLNEADHMTNSPLNIKPETFINEPHERNVMETVFGQKDIIDASTPASIIEAETKLEPETWLNMNPNHILIQQNILKSKTTSQILLSINDKYNEMNLVNMATAIHRLAKYTNSYKRYTIHNDSTFSKLIDMIGDSIQEFDTQGLSNILWSIVRLRIAPNWLPKLMELININAMNLNISELANCLFCLSKIHVKDDYGIDLRCKLIGITQDKITQCKRTLDLTCISTALARLNVRNPVLFGKISSLVIDLLPEFKMQEICGIAWSFASLGFTDHLLFSKIRNFIETNADTSNIKDVIHLAWALSKIREANDELFLYTISPIVRSHLSHLTCRDISTIAWAYSNSDVHDTDLFNDLATALQYQIDQMSVHDIASCVVAFAQLESSHKTLFKKMKSRALLLINEFTPLQLTKIIRGFAYFTDERFYSEMSKAVESKLHLMTPENIVEILVGYTEAKITPIPLFTKLLNAVSKNSRKMYAEDSLLLLEVVTNLNNGKIDLTMSKALGNLSHSLIEHIEERVSRWRCFDITQIISLFKCLRAENSGVSIVKTIVKQLPSCLNRLNNSKLELNEKQKIFTNFLNAAANLTPLKLNIIRSELSASTQLITSIRKCLQTCGFDNKHESVTEENPGVCNIDIAFNCVKIGFFDDCVSSLCDSIVDLDNENKIKDWDHITKAISLLTEVNTHIPWVKDKLKSIPLIYNSLTAESLEGAVRFMWSCVVLGEDEILINFIQKHLKSFSQLPCDMFYAQQISLHVLKCIPLPTNELSDKRYSVGNLEYGILKEWLEYKRDDLFVKSRCGKSKHTLELDYDSWISESLISMKIPHKTLHIIENMYRVSVSFPYENQILDVISFTDVLSPSGQIRASTLLRQRQLQLLGYGLHSLRLSGLYQAVKDKSLKNLIAETISSFSNIAKEHTSFIESKS